MSGGTAITLNGVALLGDPGGALLWPERGLMALADLHLEKGSAAAARHGRLLPPYDTTATLQRLETLVARHRPGLLALVGDSFHDDGAGGRMLGPDRDRLAALSEGRELVFIAGNHDPGGGGLGFGRHVAELCLGPLTFRHQAAAGAAPGEVSGHYHPTAAVRARGRRMAGPCFAHDGQRLVLPAFGAYAGGLNVLAPPLRRLFGPGLEVGIIGQGRLWRFAEGALVA